VELVFSVAKRTFRKLRGALPFSTDPKQRNDATVHRMVTEATSHATESKQILASFSHVRHVIEDNLEN
jgi:hypothetical protein